MAHCGILIGAAVRPHPGETVSGDVWRVDWPAGGCRIAVVDGLGHGPDAAAAAHRARDVLAASPEADAAEVIRLCHEALKGTRGAAIGIAAVEPESDRVTYAGVGNVEARLFTAAGSTFLPSVRGIVGARLPTVRPIATSLGDAWRLIVHSDGVSDRFDLMGLVEAGGCDPQRIADAIVERWGRVTDDATAVVVCFGPSSA